MKKNTYRVKMHIKATATHRSSEIKSPVLNTYLEAVTWFKENVVMVRNCDKVQIHSKEYDDNGLIQRDLIEYFYKW